ncbi:MAG: OmpA family protein [Bacteroidia bacterium]|nr:OmpA family protein [Bacteroidia bacterium]
MKKILLVLVSLMCLQIRGQDFMGLQSSNYAGVLGAYSNPANIVDNRYVVDIALFGLNLNADNNYIGVKRSAAKYKIQYNTGADPNNKSKKGLSLTFTDTTWKNQDPNSPGYYRNNFKLVNNGKSKAAYLSNRVVLPSFLISINRKNAIAFNWSVRNYINIDGISQDLVDLAYSNFELSRLINVRLQNKNLNVQQMAWAEYGLSYARVIKPDGPHFLKAGVTVKLLQGLEAVYFYVRDLDYQVSTKDTMSFFRTSVAYGHSDNLNFGGNNVDPGNVYKFTSSPGFGFDLGAVYEWRPDIIDYEYTMDGKTGLLRRDKNKYKVKASLAITDIGGIRFKKGGNSRSFQADVDRFNVGQFSKVDDFESLDSTLNANFPSEDNKSTFTMMLPMAVNAQLDYNVWKPVYLNLGMNFTNFFKKREAKVHDYTTISLTPRVEGKWFGLGVPVSYNTLSGSRGDFVAVGTCIRLGPLTLGSNDIMNFVGSDVFGASFYFLLKIPVPYGMKKDRDGDGVSDKKDKCWKVPGVWEFKGCPDKDGDHVQDSEDRCPDIAGLKELQGCPDKDGDGITDMDDMCPDSAGTAEFKGCPDTDGDKIMDRLDACPFEAGAFEYNGCPDKDADGIPDKDDACPEAFGLKEFKGCPDKDADGIVDKDDGCPEQSGPLENKGCPWPDTDKDGIFDKDDACPLAPGVPELKGCPKPTPSDPVPQEVPMKAAEKKIIEKAFATLEFATGKDLIKPKSFPALNELAKLLVVHSADWKLKLAGHTDNQGDPEKNMLLSEKRSKAVKTYLMKKGVTDEQVITEWFGDTMPIDDNKTPKGRQKNRRVEMKIMLKE